MTLSVGPNLGILVNGAAGDEHYDLLMKMFRAIDVLVQAHVVSIETTVPGAPADGDAYIVGAGAGGLWFGHTDKIARWSSVESLWEFYPPKQGWLFCVNDEGASGEMRRYSGTAWVALP